MLLNLALATIASKFWSGSIQIERETLGYENFVWLSFISIMLSDNRQRWLVFVCVHWLWIENSFARAFRALAAAQRVATETRSDVFVGVFDLNRLLLDDKMDEFTSRIAATSWCVKWNPARIDLFVGLVRVARRRLMMTIALCELTLASRTNCILMYSLGLLSNSIATDACRWVYSSVKADWLAHRILHGIKLACISRWCLMCIRC
jgi:hypothetical protein